MNAQRTFYIVVSMETLIGRRKKGVDIVYNNILINVLEIKLLMNKQWLFVVDYFIYLRGEMIFMVMWLQRFTLVLHKL